MMKHIALLLLFSLFWGLPAIGQETGSRKVTGYIVDSSGNPIAGATVKIKDTTTATISDGNGQFSLTVQNSESTLIATFLGYRTHEVKITPTTDNIKITLEEDAQQLDDVVVVGYGTQKKSSLTSSVEVVRGEDLKRMPVMNVNEALVGLVAGVSVQNSSGDPSSGKESDIRIRGINVIRCGMAPFPTVPLADCDGTCRLFASHEALRLFLQRQARDYFRQEYPMQRLALYDVAPLETGIRSALHRTRKKPGEGITIEQKAVLPYAIPHGIFDMAPDLEHYLRFVAQNGVGHLYVTPHNRRIVQLLHIREHGRLLPELFVPAD